MKIANVTKEFSVSSQPRISDLIHIKKMGFNSLICNRPDGEESTQNSFREINLAAEKSGIELGYLPIKNTLDSSNKANQFKDLLDTLKPPILAYCRTGNRSMALWCHSQEKQRSYDSILVLSHKAGNNMETVVNAMIRASKSK